jgi:hypothetical protein
MPRFFFHIDDGSFSADPLGSDLADLGKAQEAAVTMSGEIIRDKGAEFWTSRSPWRLHVTDHAHQLLFTLHFSADAPSAPVLFRPVEA